ncbi:hypothetical protein [Amycolatopsis anabasis]|uniref:hypothetical protein n=1 Tax=Amycolatopsis anabasis TaxID=1840409 RepID=UPI00131BC904|nr:hypothetical protein [Amycolatopsis anabasis]
MIKGNLESGEQVVTAEKLAEWGAVLPQGWTVTVRPDRFDSDCTPLSFSEGTYSAHDYEAFLNKGLVFIVVVAEVYDEHGFSLGVSEASGVEWREPGRHVGEANLDDLVSDADRRELVEDAVASAEVTA